MSINASSGKLQTSGTVLSWLVSYSVVAAIVLFVAFIRSNAGSQTHGTWEPLAAIGVPFLLLSIPAALLAALVLFVSGLTRSPGQVIRSPRWILCFVGILFVASMAVLTCALAAFIAVQNP